MTSRAKTPPFPSLPDEPTLKDAAKFAKLSQLALCSITDFNRPYLHLPLISPHLLQKDRFEVDDNEVFVIVRNSYVQLKELLKTVDRAKYSGIYI
jgi:hypothetical protein